MLDVSNPVNLERFSSGLFVVYFYPKDDTPGCTVEAKDFSSLLPQFKEQGATVVGVSKDDATSHEKFTKKHSLLVELIPDVEGEICNTFGAIGEKVNFGKKYVGIIRCTFVVKDGIVIKRWKSVQVKGHAEKVLGFIKEYNAK